MTLGMIPAATARCMTSSSGRRNAWKPISATNGSRSANRRPNDDQASASVITTIDMNQISIGGGFRSKRPSQPDRHAGAGEERSPAAGGRGQPDARAPGGGDEQDGEGQGDAGNPDANE